MSDQGFRLTSCQHCGEHIEFPLEGLGLLVACPHCAQETTLEESPAGSSPESVQETITAAELTMTLDGTVVPPRISIFYQLALLLVAMFMVLLPVTYLAFVGCIAYGTYWYGTHATVLLSGLTGGVYLYILRIIFYIGPLMGGMIAVFFMFKPILARPRKQAQPLELNPAHHPRLYQFIAQLSDLLRVPMPRRIQLDCKLNASAGFRRGLLSFLGNDLVLTLGMPLVAGLDTRQLAAVVSHELGHCTQALAMRLGYVIDGIDRWFIRVVYERDTWDEGFDEWANSVEDWRLSMIVACAGFAIWLSRRVLALLLHLGHATSCLLSRQMEFHADACAIEIAGSEGLESLLVRLREQDMLQSLAYNGLNHFWENRRQLPDSLPDFLQHLENRLPPTFHDEARLTLLNETAGAFATHPTAAQRIQKARQRAADGIVSLAKPARLLFNDFGKTARAVTSRHYRKNLQLAVTDRMLKPVGEFFAESNAGAA
ncbi:M48 family metalloprotease [bacterium]|nr:M48 family metalloprotease [bacterium]